MKEGKYEVCVDSWGRHDGQSKPIMDTQERAQL